jgi:hypothetical protein
LLVVWSLDGVVTHAIKDRPALDLEERRNLEDLFGNGCGDEQSAGALAEIAQGVLAAMTA